MTKPIPLYLNFQLEGWRTVDVYTEAMMTEAMGVEVDELYALLKNPGGEGYCYFAHPLATNNGYLFNQVSYDKNLAIQQCMQSGGHDYRQDEKYNYLPNGAVTCAKCNHTRFMED